LHGLLNRVFDLGLVLISVRRSDPGLSREEYLGSRRPGAQASHRGRAAPWCPSRGGRLHPGGTIG
jgi:hypothetical protein